MTKLKQLSDKSDDLYSGENSPWIGGAQCLAAVEAPSPGTLGKSELYRALEEATWQPGMTGKDLGVSL